MASVVGLDVAVGEPPGVKPARPMTPREAAAAAHVRACVEQLHALHRAILRAQGVLQFEQNFLFLRVWSCAWAGIAALEDEPDEPAEPTP
jgi:hypothetical protein